jgi:peptide/nickel transport system substrate-binding protein
MFRRHRRLALISALAATAVVLSACSGSAEPAPTTGTGTPDPDATLHVGLVLEPTNLDIRHTSGAALEQILIDNIYEGLVTRTQENGDLSSGVSKWTTCMRPCTPASVRPAQRVCTS